GQCIAKRPSTVRFTPPAQMSAHALMQLEGTAASRRRFRTSRPISIAIASYTRSPELPRTRSLTSLSQSAANAAASPSTMSPVKTSLSPLRVIVAADADVSAVAVKRAIATRRFMALPFCVSALRRLVGSSELESCSICPPLPWMKRYWQRRSRPLGLRLTGRERRPRQNGRQDFRAGASRPGVNRNSERCLIAIKQHGDDLVFDFGLAVDVNDASGGAADTTRTRSPILKFTAPLPFSPLLIKSVVPCSGRVVSRTMPSSAAMVLSSRAKAIDSARWASLAMGLAPMPALTSISYVRYTPCQEVIVHTKFVK